MTKTKILLVDDHKMIREGIKSFLEDNLDYEIVGEGKNGIEAIELYKSKEVDLVIADILMPVMNGMELVEELLKIDANAKIIALTMLNERQHIKQMMKLGASGYLLKNCTENQLNDAIKSVMKGEKYYSSEVTDVLMNSDTNTVKVKSRLSVEIPLTNREIEVLHLICKEYTNKEISDELFIGMRTVDAHKRNLLEKTGCKNMAGLVVYAIERNLFDDL
ncbi:MAG: response regulator transcription factor [Reichenbachiella sp.]